MNTTASFASSTLKRNSLLFWLTLLIPFAIIGIGINFILNPVGASTAYGIPIHDPAAFPFMWVKGIRDIFSGLVVMTFLFRGERRTTAILFSLAILIPVGDGLVILSHARLCAAHLYSLGNSALHDGRCCISSKKQVAKRRCSPNHSWRNHHGSPECRFNFGRWTDGWM